MFLRFIAVSLRGLTKELVMRVTQSLSTETRCAGQSGARDFWTADKQGLRKWPGPRNNKIPSLCLALLSRWSTPTEHGWLWSISGDRVMEERCKSVVRPNSLAHFAAPDKQDILLLQSTLSFFLFFTARRNRTTKLLLFLARGSIYTYYSWQEKATL